MSEPRPGYLLSPKATIFALSGVLLGMLLAALNQTIVATALPRITEDLGGLAHYSWVFSAYILASTVTVPIYGRLSDIHGRRPFFAIGIVVFMAGAVVGGTASSMTQLIVARAVQGLGAGALIPLAMAVIGDLIPPSDRGRWQAEDSGFEIASPMALAVTNKRLLSLKISNPVGLGIGGDVKELVSAAPLSDVDSIELKRVAVGKTVTVTVRGTPFVLEVDAGANAKGVAESFEQAKAQAAPA